MLFDDEKKNDLIHEMPPDNLNVEKVYQEVYNWLMRHGKKDKLAAELIEKYDAEAVAAPEYTPGRVPCSVDQDIEESTSPIWKADLEDKKEQDRLYGEYLMKLISGGREFGMLILMVGSTNGNLGGSQGTR